MFRRLHLTILMENSPPIEYLFFLEIVFSFS